MTQQQHGEGDGEVDHRRGHRRERDDQAREEVDLPGQRILAAAHALAGRGDRIGKKKPGQQAGEDEQRIGSSSRRHLGNTTEEQAEDHHRGERLQDRPRGAEDRLLVANLDVAPGEEEKQFAVTPGNLARSMKRASPERRSMIVMTWQIARAVLRSPGSFGCEHCLPEASATSAASISVRQMRARAGTTMSRSRSRLLSRKIAIRRTPSPWVAILHPASVSAQIPSLSAVVEHNVRKYVGRIAKAMPHFSIARERRLSNVRNVRCTDPSSCDEHIDAEFASQSEKAVNY